MNDDIGASVRAWTDVVRRARLGRVNKTVAFAMAQYADADGTRIFPGVARLAFDCEMSYNTIKGALVFLRSVGLVEVVRPGRTRGRADEYRLILGLDVMDNVDVPSPAQAALEIERMRDSRRGKYVPKRTPPDDLRHVVDAAETVHEAVDNSVDNESLRHVPHAADEESAARPTYAETVSAARPTDDLRHVPRPPTNHVPNTTTTNHETADLTTAVTVPRARTLEDQISDPENQTRGRHAAAENDEPEPAGNVIPFPKARAS